MKRILTFTLAFALVAFVFSSCSKDKKENEELKTLEGTEWGTNGEYTHTDGTKHQVELNFIDGKSFTLLHVINKRAFHFTGEYIYNKPNITLKAILVDGEKAPIQTQNRVIDPTITFHGTINGKTMTLNLGDGEVSIVINMK